VANLKEIRRRIRSVKNTQQITKAMKMVAATKLRHAQEAILEARPYADAMADVLSAVAVRVGPEAHPLLEVRPENKVLLVVVAADKGLCGSFNANILRSATNFLEENRKKDLTVETAGRKVSDFFKRRAYELRKCHDSIFLRLEYSTADEMAEGFKAAFLEEGFDAVYLLYNEFKSVIQQKVRVRRLLPVARSDMGLEGPVEVVDYLYEPPPAELLRELLPRHVSTQVWRALLESNAAEQGARMTSMDSATKNAGEMIDSLTLKMNKIRQAAITTEILEVVSGAEALGG